MSEPTPVDPEVAAALFRSHLTDFFANSPRVGDGVGWALEFTSDPLVAIIQMPSRPQTANGPESYALRLDGSYYDTWPVAVTFVERHNGTWRRARFGTSAFPLIAGSPGAAGGEPVGFQFALHDDYQFPDGVHDQLVCFSYNLGYYTSSHAPSDDQKWRAGRDRLDATLSRIFSVLNGPAYLGPSGGERAE